MLNIYTQISFVFNKNATEAWWWYQVVYQHVSHFFVTEVRTAQYQEYHLFAMDEYDVGSSEFLQGALSRDTRF